MGRETVSISRAVELLEDNLREIARVTEWANLMGYKSPKKFSRTFLRHHTERPQNVLKYTRLKSIAKQLRKNSRSNFEIAITHGIPDEIALNKFINYHLDCSPTDVKKMPEQQLKAKLEKLGSKISQ